MRNDVSFCWFNWWSLNAFTKFKLSILIKSKLITMQKIWNLNKYSFYLRFKFVNEVPSKIKFSLVLASIPGPGSAVLSACITRADEFENLANLAQTLESVNFLSSDIYFIPLYPFFLTKFIFRPRDPRTLSAGAGAGVGGWVRVSLAACTWPHPPRPAPAPDTPPPPAPGPRPRPL